jgi:hypothetical protein
VDGQSGSFVNRGVDSILAVSTDARYLVASDDNNPHAIAHEPGRKSLKWIGILTLIWTASLMAMSLWHRRRRFRGRMDTRT